ncbi:hypothetical protein BGZ72_003396 [Mortierella alpina]|nr:hypothetical protein BGZ72_003396 [Mortierella alpina]
MDLPEIRSHVALYLDDEELAAAAAMCKSWYATFNPLLWSTVRWNGLDLEQPTEVGIEANLESIRNLFIEYDHPANSPLNSCTHLTHLNIYLCSDNWDRLAHLVRQNTQLSSLSLYHNRCSPPPEFLTTLNESCMNLTHLDAAFLEHDYHCTQLLLDLCTRLQYLNLNGGELTDVGSLNSAENHLRWPVFARMKSLRLSFDRPGITIAHQIQWIQKCPQLRHLSWDLDEDNFDLEEVPALEILTLFPDHCPLLEELDLGHPKLADVDWSRILDACSRVKMFKASSSRFGPIAFKSLARHFASLTTLDLRRCMAVTSPMTQRILMSCPNMRWFCSGRLEARDILGVDEGQYEKTDEGDHHHHQQQHSLGLERVDEGHELVQSQDWVCTQLRFLTLYLCGLESRPPAWQDQVLRQLSRLKQLDFLTIGTNDFALDGTRDGIQLSLDAGLNQLRTLTKLDRFCFDGVAQDMTKEDVDWMLEAWPKLEAVEGRLHTDNERRRKLEKILKARDVRMCLYSGDDEDETENESVEEDEEELEEGEEEEEEAVEEAALE